MPTAGNGVGPRLPLQSSQQSMHLNTDQEKQPVPGSQQVLQGWQDEQGAQDEGAQGEQGVPEEQGAPSAMGMDAGPLIASGDGAPPVFAGTGTGGGSGSAFWTTGDPSMMPGSG